MVLFQSSFLFIIICILTCMDTLIAIKANGRVPNEIAVLAHVLVHLL